VNKYLFLGTGSGNSKGSSGSFRCLTSESRIFENVCRKLIENDSPESKLNNLFYSPMGILIVFICLNVPIYEQYIDFL
jgi:hypothetical protein